MNELATLTPQNIAQPLPDITATFAPVPVEDSGLWCQLNGAIAAHPVMSVLLLLTAAALLWPKK